MRDRRTQMMPTSDRMVWSWRIAVLGVAGIAIVLVLFPFDWLEGVWPAYGRLFDVIFATAPAHMVGHAIIFCAAGLLVLAAFHRLRNQPLPYFAIMLLGALSQEGVQDLFKREWPALGDGRDILLDAAGIMVAYIVVWLATRWHLGSGASLGTKQTDGGMQ